MDLSTMQTAVASPLRCRACPPTGCKCDGRRLHGDAAASGRRTDGRCGSHGSVKAMVGRCDLTAARRFVAARQGTSRSRQTLRHVAPRSGLRPPRCPSSAVGRFGQGRWAVGVVCDADRPIGPLEGELLQVEVAPVPRAGVTLDIHRGTGCGDGHDVAVVVSIDLAGFGEAVAPENVVVCD